MTPSTSFAIPSPSPVLPPPPYTELQLASWRVAGALAMAVGVGIALYRVRDAAPLALAAVAALSPVAARVLDDDEQRAPWVIVVFAGLGLAASAAIVA